MSVSLAKPAATHAPFAGPRPCLACGEPTADHADADHAPEPSDPTPAEAAAVVSAIADEHGSEAGAQAAASIADERGWFLGSEPRRAMHAALVTLRLGAAPASTPVCEGERAVWGAVWCGSCADRGVWHAPRNAK